MSLVAESPEVVPLETAQILYTGSGSFAFQQFQGAPCLSHFAGVLGKAYPGGVQMPASRLFALFGAGLLILGDVRLPVCLEPLFAGLSCLVAFALCRSLGQPFG